MEHLAIDNFIKVMSIMKEKLEIADVKSIQEDLENKKKSIFRKMRKEFESFM